MTAITSHKLDNSRLLTALAGSHIATGPPRELHPRSGPASAGARQGLDRGIDSILVRGRRIVLDVMDRLRDARARRHTVRELRRMDRSRLADIGIEPEMIESTVDAMIAAHRERIAMREGRSRQ